MAKPLTLYCDGSQNCTTGDIGWAYLLIHRGRVILAESGIIKGYGSATYGEYQAVMRGLLAIPPGVNIHVVTDRNDIEDIIKHPKRQKSQKSLILSYRRTLLALLTRQEVSLRVIKSGSTYWHRKADDMARKACGLMTKRQVKNAARKRRSRKFLVDN